MPRAESKQHLGTQFYHSQFGNSQYLPESTGSPSSSVSSPGQSAPQSSSSAATKKKHVCPTCERGFTTSGHLARHSRVHTGERNHKCPFPGCETRCSRQDNLQQHYRIHLSPGSRRTARSGNRSVKRGTTTSTSDVQSSVPPLSPPPLEPARIYSHATPPDSPPPLAQATLPATATLSLTASRLDTASTRSSSSSPEYNSGSHLVSMSPHLGQPGYSYRSGTTTYQEQSQGAGFTYVHTTPISQSSSYGGSHENFSSRENPSNRHSISHISHPQSYPSAQGPPSPSSSQSVSSQTSGPPTPTYPAFHDESRGTYQSNGMMSNHSGMSNGHMSSHSHLVHHGYNSNGVQENGRFDSPPPILAPIQDERFVRRDDHHQQQSHTSTPYIHHPQPLSNEYPAYHQPMGLGHGAWKAESGMRKGVGAALV